MNAEITVAIIASVASLFVAVVSLISSVITSRQSARSANEIESLKFKLEDRKATQAMSDEYLKRSLASLDTLIQAIQHVKDVVQLILNATDSSMDSESAIESTSEARLYLFKCFEEELSDLEELEAKAAHRAKNQALAFEACLQKELQGKSFVSDFSDDQRRIMLELRNDLTDCQNLLRDSKATRLAKRIQVA